MPAEPLKRTVVYLVLAVAAIAAASIRPQPAPKPWDVGWECWQLVGGPGVETQLIKCSLYRCPCYGDDHGKPCP